MLGLSPPDNDAVAIAASPCSGQAVSQSAPEGSRPVSVRIAEAEDDGEFIDSVRQVGCEDTVSEVAHSPVTNSAPAVRTGVRRKEKEPARFNGKSDWSDYKVHFDYVAVWNKWDYQEKGLQLAICLSDEAREVLTSLRGEAMHDYDTLVEALDCRYNPRGRESQYLLELMSRDCGSDEDVSTYGHTLRRLASKAYGEKPTDELMLVNTFIRGLRNVDMKRHVYHEKPQSLSDAIQAAVAYEAFDRPFRESARKPKVTIAPVQGRGTVKQTNSCGDDRPDPDAGSGAVALTAQDVAKIVKDTVAAEMRQASTQRRRRDMSTVQCYECREFGHYSRSCPKKSGANGAPRPDSRTDSSNC